MANAYLWSAHVSEKLEFCKFEVKPYHWFRIKILYIISAGNTDCPWCTNEIQTIEHFAIDVGTAE
ncbi:5349_t:CDS:2 [Dentiscutata heterogama]|uniref:5349_t:CDS:1 n=1 Tax=Dentiscutata heterogama TaxID=1316150 RepID=A0ACA9LYJ5_9GLOM|nr:5349_t:CDS:2 [Dentiscutata heterogama]